MDENEYVLSDVHLNKIPENEYSSEHYTRFKFICNLFTRSCANITQPADLDLNKPLCDEDGDFILVANATNNFEYDVVVLRHKMATKLSEVGAQLWRGALLMCDFVQHSREFFRNTIVLELGAGLSLCSIVASQYAGRTFCSDTGDKILELARRNARSNERLTGEDSTLRVVDLDWFSIVDSNSAKSFLARRLEAYPEVFLACDCVYDNILTDGLFRALYHLMNTSWGANASDVVTAYVSLEKRLNFTMQELAVTCKEYQHFRLCLETLESTRPGYVVRQVELDDLPKYFDYERVEQLELWEIKFFGP